MDTAGFRTYLEQANVDEDRLAKMAAAVETFEAFLLELGNGHSLETAGEEEVRAFSRQLVAEGGNDRLNYVGLYYYAVFIKNNTFLVPVLELLDGFEILPNLHKAIATELGEDVRDEIFAGIELPALGTPPAEWMRTMAAVFPRLEAAADHETVVRILGSGLRNLPDEYYTETKKRYEESEGLDAFLEERGKRHLDTLLKHQQEGTPYFNQMITDEVIEFVRATPEIGRGVRDGNTVIEVKIPHMTPEYLATDDPKLKQYYVCHCPCVKESILRDDIEISPTVCEFCPSFNKRPWEVIFGQKLEAEVLESALRGDLWCKFVIHLPEDAA